METPGVMSSAVQRSRVMEMGDMGEAHRCPTRDTVATSELKLKVRIWQVRLIFLWNDAFYFCLFVSVNNTELWN